MILLPYDTETTGLPNKSLDLNHPSQPHLVSIAALQVDTDWRNTGEEFIRQSMSKVVAADGWTSHPQALAVHGLTEEYTRDVGRSEKEVLDEFLHLWLMTGDNEYAHPIAHNLEFDRTIIAIAFARYYPGDPLLRKWLDCAGTCTMLSAKAIVGAQTKNGRLKNPNLQEAYEHFFPGEPPLANRHAASADAVACFNIWKALQEVGS
jgi:DNA polymerase III subunit epsilon